MLGIETDTDVERCAAKSKTTTLFSVQSVIGVRLLAIHFAFPLI